jgi:hypothetical protein
MSDTHLLPSELDDFDRALLGSAEADAPASGAVARAAVALGVAAAVAPVATAAAASAVTAAAGRTAVLSFSKWTVIGALGVAGAGTGTIAYLTSAQNSPPPAVATRPASNADARRVTPPSAPVAALPLAPAVVPPPVDDETPVAPGIVTAPAAPRAVAAPPASPVSPSTNAVPEKPAAAPAVAAPAAASPAAAAASGVAPVSIAEEVALVDRARHALRQGRAGEAFDTLSLYQSRWPNGVLATEVRVLRVETLLRLGQRASAQSDARAFIAVQPNSRYAARLRELFAPGELD